MGLRENQIAAAARQWARDERRLRDLNDKGGICGPTAEEKRAAVARADYSEQILLETVEKAVKEEAEASARKIADNVTRNNAVYRALSGGWKYRPIDAFMEEALFSRYGDLERRILANVRSGKTEASDKALVDLILHYCGTVTNNVVMWVPDSQTASRIYARLPEEYRPRVSLVVGA